MSNKKQAKIQRKVALYKGAFTAVVPLDMDDATWTALISGKEIVGRVFIKHPDTGVECIVMPHVDAEMLKSSTFEPL